jgi:hypothetical protein
MKPLTSSNGRAERRTLLLGVTLGALGTLAFRRRRAALRRAHRLNLWQRLLAERIGEVDAALCAARVQARYEELYVRRPRFAQPALRMHLKRYILPALALYQILRETHSDQHAALAEWDRLLGAPEGSPTRKALKLLGRLPWMFPIFRAAVRWRMRREFPPEGWQIEWVEDSRRRVAFNIRSCFYMKLLDAYGAPELTEHFCRLDDRAAEALPPAIVWTRSATLGRGGEVCDFCWTHLLISDDQEIPP